MLIKVFYKDHLCSNCVDLFSICSFDFFIIYAPALFVYIFIIACICNWFYFLKLFLISVCSVSAFFSLTNLTEFSIFLE